VPQLVEQALERRPEMLQAEANIEAATHGLSAARTGNAPVVTGSAGVQRRGNDFPPDNNALTVGVTVQWYPFDSGLTAGRIKQAEAGLQTAQAQLVQTRLSVVSDVSQAYLNLQTAERNVATAEAQIVNAREALRLAEGRYRSGIGVFLDVLDAQTNLDAANTNHVNALSGVDQARAALAHAIGNEEPEPG